MEGVALLIRNNGRTSELVKKEKEGDLLPVGQTEANPQPDCTTEENYEKGKRYGVFIPKHNGGYN